MAWLKHSRYFVSTTPFTNCLSWDKGLHGVFHHKTKAFLHLNLDADYDSHTVPSFLTATYVCWSTAAQPGDSINEVLLHLSAVTYTCHQLLQQLAVFHLKEGWHNTGKQISQRENPAQISELIFGIHISDTMQKVHPSIPSAFPVKGQGGAEASPSYHWMRIDKLCWLGCKHGQPMLYQVVERIYSTLTHS